MLSSIHPLGEAGRQNRYSVTAAAFVIGSTVGGIGTGAMSGVVGVGLTRALAAGASQWWLDFGGPVLVVAVGGWTAAHRVVGRSLPSLPRQVNENWLNEFRGWVYGVGFGLQLGCGVATYIRSVAVFVWVAAMIAAADFGRAVCLGAVFGLVRGASLFRNRSVTSPEALVAFHRRLHRARADIDGPRLARAKGLTPT